MLCQSCSGAGAPLQGAHGLRRPPRPDLYVSPPPSLQEDRALNKKHKPALQKLSILNRVVGEMRRSDLQPVFIENNAYEQIANWLRPLPDGSLPNLRVRYCGEERRERNGSGRLEGIVRPVQGVLLHPSRAHRVPTAVRLLHQTGPRPVPPFQNAPHSALVLMALFMCISPA